MNTIVSLEQCRSDLISFCGRLPLGKEGTQPWRTAQGPLLASENQARVDLLEKYTPAHVADFCQKHSCTVAELVGSRPELDRFDFMVEFYQPEVAEPGAGAGGLVPAGARAQLEMTSVYPSGSQQSGDDDASRFIDGEPDGPAGTQPWRTAQGPLMAGEHAARKQFTTDHPSKAADAMMARHSVDLDTVVASTSALDRQGYVDRYHTAAPSGNNTGEKIVPQDPQKILSTQPGRTVEEAALGLVAAGLDSAVLQMRMKP